MRLDILSRPTPLALTMWQVMLFPTPTMFQDSRLHPHHRWIQVGLTDEPIRWTPDLPDPVQDESVSWSDILDAMCHDTVMFGDCKGRCVDQ